MKYPSFVGGTYRAITARADAESCINLYQETLEAEGAAARKVLVGTPGTTVWATLPTGPVRGLWAGDNRCFAVGGSKLYEVSGTGVSTLRGDVGDDTDHTPAEIFPNGNQIMIVSAGKAYIDNGVSVSAAVFPASVGTVTTLGFYAFWADGDKFSPDMVGGTVTIAGLPYTAFQYLTDEALMLSASPGTHSTPVAYSCSVQMSARTGAFLDTYFCVAPPSNRTVYISYPNDGGQWDAADVGVKESYPDNIARILADHSELWVLGYQSGEVWRNTGNQDFPLERVVSIPWGNKAPWSTVRIAGGVAWLGSNMDGNLSAWHAVGFEPKRVSTHALELAWGTLPNENDVFGWTYSERGHDFWVVSFTQSNRTWVWDATENLWHERAWWNGSGLERIRARCHAYVFGAHVVGDRSSGVLYRMGDDLYTDAGVSIHRYRLAPHVADGQDFDWLFYGEFSILAQTGATTNPDFQMQYSNDGGVTFTALRACQNVAIGDNTRRLIWRRLGRARSGNRCFAIATTGAFPVRIIDAELEVSKS